MAESLVPYAMLTVGGVELVIGALFVFAPGTALQLVLGRTLTVGAGTAPGITPLISQTGALRLALSVFLLAIGMCGASDSMAPEAIRMLAGVAVVYCGLLQPYILLFRSHHRMPVGWQVGLCLVEGFAIVAAIAADGDFDMATLAHRNSFVFSAVVMLCAVLLTLAGGAKSCCVPLQAGDAELALGDTPQSGLSTSLLFDEGRHTLSPASRRLLQ